MDQPFDRTLKALALVLSYPTRELQQAMPEIAGVLAADSRLTAAARRALRPLLDDLRDRDIYDLEELYVLLFDRSRTLSLNLFEHVHGESRDRGSAMCHWSKPTARQASIWRPPSCPITFRFYWNSCPPDPLRKFRKSWRTRPISLRR